ncbi:MAG: phosphotransferase family protein [Patulibacter sp.]
MNPTRPAHAPSSSTAIPGIDAASLEAWWARSIADVRPLTFERIPGGRSNLTYRVHDRRGTVSVLRRPPVGPLLNSAHDLLREARIVRALAGSNVPVPAVLAACEDANVIGAPFYVMEHVDGVVLHDAAQTEQAFSAPDRRRLSERAIDVLAGLHCIDPEAQRLGDLGRRDAYVARQLRRWDRQWHESRTRDVPAVDELHARLSAAVPAQTRTAIVHGDYRLGNLIVGEDAEIRAVLDWELCTLGDPLADLGYTLAWWDTDADAAGRPLGAVPSAAPEMPSRDELLARYAARTGFDVSRIDYFLAFAYWRIACIMEGVRSRDLKTSPETAPPLDQVPALAELGLEALAR